MNKIVALSVNYIETGFFKQMIKFRKLALFVIFVSDYNELMTHLKLHIGYWQFTKAYSFNVINIEVLILL